MTEEQITAITALRDVARQMLAEIQLKQPPAYPMTYEVTAIIWKVSEILAEAAPAKPLHDLFDLEEARRILEQQHDRIKALEDVVNTIKNQNPFEFR